MIEPTTVCYRLYLDSDLDPERVWRSVSRMQGHMQITALYIDYYIPRDSQLWFVLQFPELTRRREREYI